MFVTTGVLFVLARTGSPALAGATAAASSVAGALAGPLLGALLDAAPRKRVLIVGDQLASVAALGAMLVLAGHAPGWTLPLCAVLLGITRPFSVGGFFSALNEIAGAELLDDASRIESVSLNLSFILGPAAGGIVAGAAGVTVAVEVQLALTLLAAALIAVNPAFEATSDERPDSARHALSQGLRALGAQRMLRAPGLASMLAAFGWGLMNVGFPLYAVHYLHAGAHINGYMWAAVAGGSIAGTFALAGPPARSRIALSYMTLGLSALLWPLVHVAALGVGLIFLTGFLEGPAYSGTVALRQRYAPPSVRAQVVTTLGGATMICVAAGAALAGVIGAALPAIIGFVAVNLLAALVAWRV